jgi:hypothetical protein
MRKFSKDMPALDQTLSEFQLCNVKLETSKGFEGGHFCIFSLEIHISTTSPINRGEIMRAKRCFVSDIRG